MDTEVLAAVTIVDLSHDQAEEWFRIIRDTYSDTTDWDMFQEKLTASTGGFGAAAETFLRHVAEHGRIELIGRLVADFDALSTSYAGAKAGPETPMDGGLWEAAVEQFGSGWAGWDGSADGWVEFRDWFYAAASSYGPEMYAVVFERLDPLNDVPLAERVARLTEFGFTISVSASPLDQMLDESLAAAMEAVPEASGLSTEDLERMRAEIIEELSR